MTGTGEQEIQSVQESWHKCCEEDLDESFG